MAKILCIHPYDDTTAFLSEILESLQDFLKEDIHIFSIDSTIGSHKECLAQISIGKEDVIFFMGHGASDCLWGARASHFTEDDTPSPGMVGEYGPFINATNIEVFANKKVLCFSCHSGIELGSIAFENNTKVFLGFGDVPTSVEEFRRIGYEIPENEVILFRKDLNWIMIQSLLFSLKNKYNFFEIKSMIRLFTNLRSREILFGHGSYTNRRDIADAFFHFKKGIQIHGDGKLKILDT